MMALKTKVLPKTVVIITVISALIPKDCIDLFHKTIPGMVANNANISPKPGTRYKAKATNTNAIVAIIVALGCILKTHKPLPYF